MRYEELMRGLPYRLLQAGEARSITSLGYDSRRVLPGGCCVCMKGTHADGLSYLEEIRRRGAAAIVVDRERADYGDELTVLWVKDLLWAMPRMAANFYPNCREKLRLIGVTGTNGKTTVSTLMHHIMRRAGIRCGLIGTNGNRILDRYEKTAHTTPWAFDLYALLDRMQREAVQSVLLEVSSHALAEHRVDGLPFRLGIFTNLTQDHLDYHQTMEAYREAKTKLFTQSDEALLNGDDPACGAMQAASKGECLLYGLSLDASYRADEIQLSAQGIDYRWHGEGRCLGRIRYPIPGRFNVYNTLAAAAGAHRCGVAADVIAEALWLREPVVDGRFQSFYGPDGLMVIVDYAHTPDGLLKVLETIREFAKGRVVTVFGCGGERDALKRPRMGRIAGEYSDYCILTSDNPRWEDPWRILSEIEEGLAATACSYEKELDRRIAIEKAIRQAEPQDVILVAGKGHESGQLIQGELHPMDDRTEVQRALRLRSERQDREGETDDGAVKLKRNCTVCKRTDRGKSGAKGHDGCP